MIARKVLGCGGKAATNAHSCSAGTSPGAGRAGGERLRWESGPRHEGGSAHRAEHIARVIFIPSGDIIAGEENGDLVYFCRSDE